MKMINYLKQIILGIHQPGIEYWVNIDEIKITQQFSMTPPRYKKMKRKWNYYKKTGEFQSQIILNQDFKLIDGYTSYCIAKKQGLNKVPVIFK